MSNIENDWPEDGGVNRNVEIKMEDCWSQPREGETHLFYRLPAARFKIPDDTEIICPRMSRYAIIPVEELTYLYSVIRPGMLTPRLRAMRKSFLAWAETLRKELLN